MLNISKHSSLTTSNSSWAIVRVYYKVLLVISLVSCQTESKLEPEASNTINPYENIGKAYEVIAKDLTFEGVLRQHRGNKEYYFDQIPLLVGDTESVEQLLKEYRHRRGTLLQVPGTLTGALVKEKSTGKEYFYVVGAEHRCNENLLEEDVELRLYAKHFDDGGLVLYDFKNIKYWAMDNGGSEIFSNDVGYRLCHQDTSLFAHIPNGWLKVNGQLYERLVPATQTEALLDSMTAFGLVYELFPDLDFQTFSGISFEDLVEEIKNGSTTSSFIMEDEFGEFIYLNEFGYFVYRSSDSRIQDDWVSSFAFVYDPDGLLNEIKNSERISAGKIDRLEKGLHNQVEGMVYHSVDGLFIFEPTKVEVR